MQSRPTAAETAAGVKLRTTAFPAVDPVALIAEHHAVAALGGEPCKACTRGACRIALVARVACRWVLPFRMQDGVSMRPASLAGTPRESYDTPDAATARARQLAAAEYVAGGAAVVAPRGTLHTSPTFMAQKHSYDPPADELALRADEQPMQRSRAQILS